MCSKQLLERLKCLSSDLTDTEETTKNLMSYTDIVSKDRMSFLENEYFSMCSPVGSSGLEPKVMSDGDMCKVMTDLSFGYDEYLKRMEEMAKGRMNRRLEALKLLKGIISLPSPYSEILYLKYFKNLTNAQLRETMFFSRTTFYRKLDEAYERLEKSIDFAI